MVEANRQIVFDACVDMLGQLPSVALKGASKGDVVRLLAKYRKQGRALKDMMK